MLRIGFPPAITYSVGAESSRDKLIDWKPMVIVLETWDGYRGTSRGLLDCPDISEVQQGESKPTGPTSTSPDTKVHRL
jgi:hypothetical protein